MDKAEEGFELMAGARALLDAMLGSRWGFVRWADREDALLATDAGRAAARRGIECAPIFEALTRAGWSAIAEKGLWLLDPPEEAFRCVLRARPLPAGAASAAWRDGDLGELQAACVIMLRGGSDQEDEASLDEPVRALIREAWKRLDGPPERVNRWMREAVKRFAVARRSGAFTGEYACGVLLERYLRRMGCGLP